MLLSKKYNFIFIHVPKVAGQSVKNALVPYAASSWQHQLNRVVPFRYQMKLYTKLRGFTKLSLSSQPFDDHVRAGEVSNTLGAEVFKSYFSFAFVRNPWAWTLSRYTYALGNSRHFRHSLVKSFEGFGAYLDWHCNHDEKFYLQKSFLCDGDGQQLIDFVGKQEQLKNDFQYICERLEITAKLPHFNSSRVGSYRDHYNAAMRDLVAEKYAEDIEYFGYDF